MRRRRKGRPATREEQRGAFLNSLVASVLEAAGNQVAVLAVLDHYGRVVASNGGVGCQDSSIGVVSVSISAVAGLISSEFSAGVFKEATLSLHGSTYVVTRARPKKTRGARVWGVGNLKIPL